MDKGVMAKVLILDKSFGGIENIVRVMPLLRKRFSALPVVANEPVVKAALSVKKIDSEMILHLLTENEDIEIYAAAEEICRRINSYLADEAGAVFCGINLFDLNLLDIAYTLRHLISLDYLANNRFSGRDWAFASIRFKFCAPYAGAYDTVILNPEDFLPKDNMIRSDLKRLKDKLLRSIRTVSERPATEAEGIFRKPLPFPGNESGKKRVLFALTETASGIVRSSFLPLLAELQKQNEFQPVIAVNSKAAAAAFESAGIKNIFWPQELTQEAARHMESLKKALPATIDAEMRKMVPGSAEYNIWVNYLAYGLEGLTESYKAIEFFKSLYENFIPDIVVTSADRTILGKAAVLMAKKIGIPSMLYYPCLIRNHSWFRDCYTDAVGSYGLHNEQCLTANGLGSKKVYRIGNPKFDSMAGRDRRTDKENIYKKLNIQPGRKLVVIVGSLVVPDAAKWLGAVAKEFEQYGDGTISAWLKPHPGDVLTEYESIVRESGAGNAVNLLTEPVDNYELLSAADLVITDFSTFGAEAILMKVPVITVNMTGRPYCVRFEESGAAELITEIDKFWEALTKTLNNPRARLAENYPKAEALYGYKIDGLAVSRFIEAIKDLVKESGEKYEDNDADIYNRRKQTAL